MISAQLQFKPTNSKAWDLFGRLEFSIEKHILAISGETIRYGVVVAEVTFSLEGGTSERESWFADQAIGSSVAATITETQDVEQEQSKGKSSGMGLSKDGPSLEDSHSATSRKRAATKIETQYKTQLVNVRAVGTSATPTWHFFPQIGERYLAGALPPANTRLMSVLPNVPHQRVVVTAHASFQYSLIDLSGQLSKPNAAIMAQAIWFKHFRSKTRNKKLSEVSTPEKK